MRRVRICEALDIKDSGGATLIEDLSIVSSRVAAVHICMCYTHDQRTEGEDCEGEAWKMRQRNRRTKDERLIASIEVN